MGEEVSLGVAAQAFGTTIHALRKRRERNLSFPAPTGYRGHIPIYDLEELRAWHEANPEATRLGRPTEKKDRSTYRRTYV